METYIWSEQTSVKTSETDFLQRWRLSSFFIAMQEVASTHAERLGVGYQALLDQNMVWVLSRVKIRIFDFPLVGDELTIQTWPKGLQQKLFFMRDFHILSADGRKLAAASSAYVLVDPSARRALMPTALPRQVPDNNGLSAIAEPLEKILVLDGLAPCLTVQAGYSAVDLVGHVNNARYVDWISDCFPFEQYRTGRPSWLQVNFINEVKPGESVALACGAYPDDRQTWYITGTNQNSGAKAFDAAMGWEL